MKKILAGVILMSCILGMTGYAQDWEKDTAYVGGDEVVYQDKIYRAKWWTYGELPDHADVWEATGSAEVRNGTEGLNSNDDGQQSAVTESDSAGKQEQDADSPFKVVGYFPSWKSDTGKIRYDVLTHINFAFAIPTEEGGLLPLENAQTAQQIIEEAHRNGVKVFLAVGGWSYQETPLEYTFVKATETQEKRSALSEALCSMCDTYGFDGVDLDWEHPRVDNGSSEQYEALIVELAGRLHAQGKQLSSAVISGVTADGIVYYDAPAHTDCVLETVDWINVMAYDGGDGERHSSYDFAVNCGAYWREQRGMPSEKVVLGVPFYARPSWASYGDILNEVPDAGECDHTEYWGMDVWYNGNETIRKKTAYALEQLGGVMIWEISQDAAGEKSLQAVIGKEIKS